MKVHATRIFAIVLCLILPGCESPQFFYNHAGWFLNYRADRYLDLGSTQKPYVKQEIRLWLDWHRHAQLLCYADLIDQFETRAREDLTSADLIWLESELSGHYETLLTRAMGPTMRVLSDLDQDQINHLEKRLVKDQSKLKLELKRDSEDQGKGRAKKTIAGLKKWFGGLSRAQIRWVSQRNQELADVDGPWLEYRAQRDRSLIELLRFGTDPKTMARTLTPMWANVEASMSSDTEALMGAIKMQSRVMAVDFYGMATIKQKTHFWKRLQDYRNDFLQLARNKAGATCESPGAVARVSQLALENVE